MKKEMAKVGIVTTCNQSLPDGILREYEITMLSHPLTLEGRNYMIPDTISSGDFIEVVRKAKGFPKTVAVNASRFAEAYKRLRDEGKSIVSVIMSGGIMSQPTLDAARKAIEMAPGADVSVVNTHQTCGAVGVVVLEAARAAKEGKSKEEVAKIAQEVSSHSHLILALPNLEYLHRGGRISRAKALLGSLIKVIPLVTMRAGAEVITPIGKGRNVAQVNQKIIKTIKKDMEDIKATKIKAVLMDVNNPKATQALKEVLEKNINCEEIIIGTPRCEIVHGGPDGWTIGYYLIK